MKKHTAIRWEVERAAREFDISPRTLRNRLTVYSIEVGSDRKFSTKQICSAIFGDIDGERLRLTRAQADEKELANSQTRLELVNFSDLLELTHRALSAIKSTVMGMTHLKIEDREAIINQLRSAGEAVVNGPGGDATAAEIHGKPVG